jgi:hypothetical protein
LCNAAKRAPEAALPIKARILQVRAFRRQGSARTLGPGSCAIYCCGGALKLTIDKLKCDPGDEP